jgi:sulfite oxidase
MAPAEKTPSLEYLSRRPIKAQTALNRLVHHRQTANEDFYVCCHGTIPKVDIEAYRLLVDGMVQRPLRLRFSDLSSLLADCEVEATLQCAGNRRRELDAVRRTAKGEPRWGASAIGSAVWKGVPLVRLLDAAGVLDGAAHVAFYGLDRCSHRGRSVEFAGSIPIHRALDGSVLLAHAMNGAPLPEEHGFPLRVVVPGYIGARSVKWVYRIEVRSESSDSPFQRESYKLLTDPEPQEADWSAAPELGELSVNSAIGTPVDGAEVVAGTVVVSGWSMAGGGRTVARVEVSSDHGRHWIQAALRPSPVGTWSLWEAEMSLTRGSHELVCRAWDSAANVQPEEPSQVWNVHGYMNHSWHRVRVWAD